jgi:hypothetical protein
MFKPAFRYITATTIVFSALGAMVPVSNAFTLVGDSVSASIESLGTHSRVITQFNSPQNVVDPGVEFTGGVFTPFSRSFPLPIQMINSFGAEVDVQDSGFQITFLHLEGSITGAGSNIGSFVRFNLMDLNPSDGSIISNIRQTAGRTNSVTTMFTTSSVHVDFRSVGAGASGGELPDIYEFVIETTSVPEPSTILGLTTTFAFGTLLKQEFSKKKNKS